MKPPKAVIIPLALVAFLLLPFLIRWSRPTPPAVIPRETPTATPVPPAPAPPPVPMAGPPTHADPLLGRWQVAIRKRDSQGVLSAQSVFLDREAEYREPLEDMAKKDPDPRIRAFSVAVLGRMKSPPPEPYFLERLDDPSEHPRVSALNALEKIGTAACLAAADRLASSDPAEGVRAAAAQAAKAVRSR